MGSRSHSPLDLPHDDLPLALSTPQPKAQNVSESAPAHFASADADGVVACTTAALQPPSLTINTVLETPQPRVKEDADAADQAYQSSWLLVDENDDSRLRLPLASPMTPHSSLHKHDCHAAIGAGNVQRLAVLLSLPMSVADVPANLCDDPATASRANTTVPTSASASVSAATAPDFVAPSLGPSLLKSLTAPDANGFTAIMSASAYTRSRSPRRFQRKPSPAGRSPRELLAAAESAKHDGRVSLMMVRLLLHAGVGRAAVNAADAQGMRAVHWAARCGHAAALRALIVEGGADANAACERGERPLHIASRYGEVECIRVLLREIPCHLAAPSVIARNCLYESALDVAGMQPALLSSDEFTDEDENEEENQDLDVDPDQVPKKGGDEKEGQSNGKTGSDVQCIPAVLSIAMKNADQGTHEKSVVHAGSSESKRPSLSMSPPSLTSTVCVSVASGGQVKQDLVMRSVSPARTVTPAPALTASVEVHEHCCRVARAALYECAPQLRTCVLWHAECLGHTTPARHQESPLRQCAVLEALRDAARFAFAPVVDAETGSDAGAATAAGVTADNNTGERPAPSEAVFCTDFAPATRTALLRAHSRSYVDMVFALDAKIASLSTTASTIVPFTPHVQRRMGAPTEELKKGSDCDTCFSRGSLKAATRAAGSVMHAIDEVVAGKARNAFCAVRPPGHHAGVDGLGTASESCGFCIFNHVAIGALYALSAHNATVQRVAIVDFDVHHGNGTQEIVQRQRSPSNIFFFSIHICDRSNQGGDTYEFYPGTGQHDEMEDNIINVPLAPLWKTKQRKNTFGGRSFFRAQLAARLYPALRAFNPDLVLLSSGFDAGKHDIGNSKIDKRYIDGMDVEPRDFEWLTRKIQRIADVCCDGRLVSVLEGGYGRYERKQDPKSTVCRSTLANNVAAHVRGLIGPSLLPPAAPDSPTDQQKGHDMHGAKDTNGAGQRDSPQPTLGRTRARSNSMASEAEAAAANAASKVSVVNAAVSVDDTEQDDAVNTSTIGAKRKHSQHRAGAGDSDTNDKDHSSAEKRRGKRTRRASRRSGGS